MVALRQTVLQKISQIKKNARIEVLAWNPLYNTKCSFSGRSYRLSFRCLRLCYFTGSESKNQARVKTKESEFSAWEAGEKKKKRQQEQKLIDAN